MLSNGEKAPNYQAISDEALNEGGKGNTHGLLGHSEDGNADNNNDSNNNDGSNNAGDTYTIEEAVEKLGFGKFQLKILFICGIMTSADAMEMLLLAVLGPVLRCEWHLSSSQVAIITTVVFIGMFAGAPAWGAISDKFGRWTVFAISLTLIAYFGFLCSFSPTYLWVIILRGLVGFNIGGAASSFTLLSEYLPQRYRAKVLIAYNIFWGFGSTFEILLAYMVLPTLGWRYLTAFSALPLFLFMLALGLLPESARFLLASGRVNEAEMIVQQIARQNGKPPMKGRPAAIVVQEEDRGTFKSLLSRSYRSTTLILFFLWFGVAFSYYGIVLVSTEIFRFHKDCFGHSDVVVGHNRTETVIDSSCCKGLQNDDYRAMLISSFGEFVIIPLNMLMIDGIGRKWTLAANYGLTGLFFGLSYLCVPKSVTTAFLFMVRAHASGIFNTIYIYTAEIYPTVVRSIGLGMCSSMARLGSMSTPFVAQVIMPDTSIALAFTIYVVVDAACCILSLLLPIETKGRALKQALETHVEFKKIARDTGGLEANGEANAEANGEANGAANASSDGDQIRMRAAGLQ